MNVVIDTSVIVASLISSEGASREVLRLALRQTIKPQIGLKLFLELEAVLKRDEILQRTPLSYQEVEILLQAFFKMCEWNEVYYLWRPNLKDKDDDFVVELAVASNASVIITTNKKDFLAKELGFGFKIQTPQEFLKELR